MKNVSERFLIQHNESIFFKLTLAPVRSAYNLSPSCGDGVLLPVNYKTKKYTLINKLRLVLLLHLFFYF